MRSAYLDCFSGMSGDMFLGALVDAGVPARLFEETIAALNVGARLDISRVNRSGIRATKVDVYVNGEKELPREQYGKRLANPMGARPGMTKINLITKNPPARREQISPLPKPEEEGPGPKDVREGK